MKTCENIDFANISPVDDIWKVRVPSGEEYIFPTFDDALEYVLTLGEP